MFCPDQAVSRVVLATCLKSPSVLFLGAHADIHLTGTKLGCAEGGCGACTVMVSHQAGTKLVHRSVNACLCPLYAVEGMHVVTVEGECMSELVSSHSILVQEFPLCKKQKVVLCCLSALTHVNSAMQHAVCTFSVLTCVQVSVTQGVVCTQSKLAWQRRMAPNVASAHLALSCQCTLCSDQNQRHQQRPRLRTIWQATFGTSLVQSALPTDVR